MNKWDYLANLFSEALGEKYDIKYYENNEAKWESILIDDMIHGNMLVSNGTTTKTAGTVIETQQIAITFALPIELVAFSEAIQTIEDTFKDLHGLLGSYSGNMLAYSYSYRSDAVKVTIKGTDYATMTVYGMLISYEEAVLASEAKLTINGTVLEGVISIIYSNQHATEGAVYGFSSPIQKNYLTGISATFTIDLIFRKTDALHLELMKNIDTNKEYSVAYYNGIVSRIYSMMVIRYDENAIVGDILKGQIVLGIKG